MFHAAPFRSQAESIAALLFALAATATTQAQILSDNLENATAGTESATAARWLAGSFRTDNASYPLRSITLLLANTVSGTAALDLYDDGGLEPGVLIVTLTPPAAYSPTPADATFTAAGNVLNPNTTYWAVLRPLGGTFDWAWTSNNDGVGVGFLHTWGSGEQAGAAWYTYDIYPIQFAVVVGGEPCAGDVNGDFEVNLADLAILLAHFGQTSGANLEDGDLDGDGDVALEDLAILLSAFGTTCP
jgi:hypothetical protein